MKIRILSFIVSASIIAFLYWQIDFEKIIQVLVLSNLKWLAFGLVLIIPTTLLTAFRLTFLSLDSNKINYLDALKLILAASVMNIVLPSKMGDVAKGVFIVKDKNIAYSQAMPLVVFEKINDLLALLLWCVFGLLVLQNFGGLYLFLLGLSLSFLVFGLLAISSKSFINSAFDLIVFLLPRKFSFDINQFRNGWSEVCNFVNKDKTKVFWLSLLSIFIWFVHLFQIWLFILALSPNVSFFASLAITPIVIFAGLIPLTFSGIGTRDFAFIFFYSAYFSAATGAALGLLATLRYIIPAIAGIPFFSYYIKKIR